MDIIWKPGQGANSAAIERMKQHFPKPTKPSFEAWFMSGEIKYVNWLMDLPVEQYDRTQLENYLYDTGGGIKSFERYEEWVIWYHYLFPYLSTRILEGDLLCHTITYFFNLYPDEIVEEYVGFRDDVLKVIPHYIMSEELYKDGDLDIDSWWFEDREDLKGHWTNAFVATMFFCLKYLTPEEIKAWVSSFALIKAVILRGEIDKWIASIKKFLYYVSHPEQFPTNEEIRRQVKDEGIGVYLKATGIYWWHAYLIFGGQDLKVNKRTQLSDYLPLENIDAFLAAVRQYESNSTR